MSVNDGEQIGYPSYSDAELKGGAVISERYFDLSSL